MCKILLQKKKKRFFKEKLTKCVGKPKNIWKTQGSKSRIN